MITTYSEEDYILFFLAIALFLGGLALLGIIIECLGNRKARRQEDKLHSLNRREEWHRQHNTYLAKMQEVLDSIEGRHGV